MAIVEGNDEVDSISVTVFPELYRFVRQMLVENQVFLIEGKVQRSNYNGQLQMVAYQIQHAETLEKSFSSKMYFGLISFIAFIA